MAKTVVKPDGQKRFDRSVLQVKSDGSVEVKRDVLHASDGYKRQVAALAALDQEMKKVKSG